MNRRGKNQVWPYGETIRRLPVLYLLAIRRSPRLPRTFSRKPRKTRVFDFFSVFSQFPLDGFWTLRGGPGRPETRRNGNFPISRKSAEGRGQIAKKREGERVFFGKSRSRARFGTVSPQKRAHSALFPGLEALFHEIWKFQISLSRSFPGRRNHEPRGVQNRPKLDYCKKRPRANRGS